MTSLFYILLLSFLISACSRGPVQQTAKDLCTGTKKPYKIKGNWYHPHNDYDHYEESGVASWYGPGFHNRPKSCGNKFDMHELSAAHKTLPIPSVVEVTNLENGKKLKLVIDDRGPFIDNRIIDLSKKAAIELGAHGKGLARVRVVAIPHESKALSSYLRQYGRYGKVPDGRTWSDIYYQEISGNLYSSIETPPVVTSPIVTQAVKPIKKQKPSALMPKHHLSLKTLNSIIYEHATPPTQNQHKDNEQITKKIEEILLSSPTSPKKPAMTKKLYIEVGSFVQQQNAENLKNKLAKIGSAALQNPSPHTGQPFFTVKMGPYETEKEAKKVMEKLKEWGHYGPVLTRH